MCDGQEPRENKRHRGEDGRAGAPAADPFGIVEHSEPVTAEEDGQADHMEVNFPSSGAQDVNAINETGDTMAARPAPPQQPQVPCPASSLCICQPLHSIASPL